MIPCNQQEGMYRTPRPPRRWRQKHAIEGRRLTDEKRSRLRALGRVRYGPYGALEKRNREIVRLRTEEGMTYGAIAEVMGMSRQRVHQIVRRETDS